MTNLPGRLVNVRFLVSMTIPFSLFFSFPPPPQGQSLPGDDLLPFGAENKGDKRPSPPSAPRSCTCTAAWRSDMSWRSPSLPRPARRYRHRLTVLSRYPRPMYRRAYRFFETAWTMAPLEPASAPRCHLGLFRTRSFHDSNVPELLSGKPRRSGDHRRPPLSVAILPW